MHGLSRRSRPILGFAALVASGCGSPTTFQYQDVTFPDVREIDVVQPLPEASFDGDALVCGGTIRELTQSNAEVIFVVDRSGSMLEPGADGVPKWSQLERTLNTVLPRVQQHIAMGLILFPTPGLDPNAMACEVAGALEVTPAFSNATAFLTVLNQTSPGGGTPTYSAIQTGVGYVAAEPDPLARRYLVLVTDGGPNCNSMLDATTCRCSGPYPSCSVSNPDAAEECLDDRRTESAIQSLLTAGTPTFVVGLLGTESFGDVLDSMAVAGGEARASEPRYYNASSTLALTQAMDAITSGISDCHFQLDSAPSDPTLVDVRLGGMRIPYDPQHRNGWDWVAGSMYMDIEFFGTSCDDVRDATGGVPLVAAFGCAPLPAPP